MKDFNVPERVLEHYLESSDFNGLPLTDLVAADLDEGALLAQMKQLISDGILELISSRHDLNPHIKRFPAPSMSEQLKVLRSDELICLYPSKTWLATRISPTEAQERPFTRQMILGEAQLKPVFFELAVLERYHSDPRYLVDPADFGGRISISNDYYESENLAERDKISIQTFGLAKNQDGSRAVTVFLRYLKRLTSDHQRYWESFRIDSAGCSLDEDYFRTAILGEWLEYISIYEAFLEEQYIIIEMSAQTAGGHRLFRKNFRHNRPVGFGFFLRPTRKSYYDFCMLLDKLMSENLSKRFFAEAGLEMEHEIERKGRVEIVPKGTITLLQEWLTELFPHNNSEIEQIVHQFRTVRKQRQKPAHKVDENTFDPAYHRDQDQLIEGSYQAMRALRLLLSQHAYTKTSLVPEWLKEGKVKIY
jgi:hypothetical protein